MRLSVPQCSQASFKAHRNEAAPEYLQNCNVAQPQMRAETAKNDCFCVKFTPNSLPPYYVARLGEPACQQARFQPRQDAAAPDYLKNCDAAKPEDDAKDLQKKCFCVSYTPDELPPYRIMRFNLQECADMEFKPQPDKFPGDYLDNCAAR